MLILWGLLLVAAGGLLWGAERLGLGKLPGDLVFRGKRWTVHMPLATSLLLSLVLSLLMSLWMRRK